MSITNALTLDANNRPIPYASTAVYKDTKDYPSMPWISPDNVDSSGQMEFNPPDNALTFTFIANASSTISDTTDGSYGVYTVPANNEKTIPCLNVASIFVTAAEGTTISFYFEVI